MDLLAQLFASGGTPTGPTDDFWYGPVGQMTAAGVRLNPDTALTVSPWYRGKSLLGASFAMLPCPLMERLPDGSGAIPAVNHPLYDRLHRSPNETDDDYVWKHRIIDDLIDYGHSFHWIAVDRSWELDRINPKLVTVEVQTIGRRTVELFHVRDEKTGRTTVHTSDDIFHLQLADGKGIFEHAKESIALAMVTEQYASKVFSNGTLKGGIIEVTGQMNDESARSMARSFVTSVGEWHMPQILPMGAKWAPTQPLRPDQAQMLDSRKFAINEMARWLGVPPHMISDLERATFSNIEHQGQEFVTYSLGSWLTLFESGVNKQLVLQPNKYFVEFTRDALVRGDIAARWQAYTAAVTTGTFTRNEIRELENRNPLPGLDKPLDPAHLTGKQPKAKGPTPVSENASAKAEAIVQGAASRVLRKEIAAVQKMAVRHAADGDAFAAAVTEFYQGHVALVVSTLHMTDAAADEYCAGQAAQALHEWVSAVQLWGAEDYAAGLAGLALEAA